MLIARYFEEHYSQKPVAEYRADIQELQQQAAWAEARMREQSECSRHRVRLQKIPSFSKYGNLQGP